MQALAEFVNHNSDEVSRNHSAKGYLSEKLLFFTIVRLMWAKAHQKRVSSYNPTLQRVAIGCTPVLGFSLNPNILVGQQ
jgi:hypothetical protein